MNAALAVDLEAGIPVNTPLPTAEDRRREWRRSGAPYEWHSRSPQPPLWEEERWLEDYTRAGCKIICTHGSIGYRMPDPVLDTGCDLLAWIDAAEKRKPGIGYRIHKLALDYDSISKGLESYEARQKAKRLRTRATGESAQ